MKKSTFSFPFDYKLGVGVIQKRRGVFLRYALLSLAFLMLGFYFGYYALWSKKGYFALKRETKMLAMSSKELSILEANNLAMIKNIQDLTPPDINIDLLDEKVRRTLDYVEPQDTVTYLTRKNQKERKRALLTKHSTKEVKVN